MTRNEMYAEYRASKIGETIRAKNGQLMTIIVFNSTRDITVQFEDGTIVEKIRYQQFQQGSVGNPNFSIADKIAKEKLGEESISNTGEKMKIIAYRGCRDLDVQFEDGEVLHNVRYDSFQNGTLHSPKNSLNITRVGETRQHNNGQTMTIVAYRGNQNVDVLFSDGTLVTDVRYDAFRQGVLRNPNFKKEVTKPKVSKKINYKEERIGQVFSAKDGMYVTIIDYRGYNDVDVKFEDGTILKNVNYQSLQQGTLRNPHAIKPTKIQNQPKTNAKSKGVPKQSTYLLNLEENRKSKVGQTSIAVNGQTMTIVEYRKFDDIDILFEDGTMVYHKSYSNFHNGTVKNPNFKISYDRSDVRKSSRLGEKNLSAHGQMMTIIAYKNCKNIDIQFEDGTIVKKKNYQCFKKGIIKNPNYNLTKIGETSIATNGQLMEIIDYRNNQDLDVKFEDGTIATKKDYRSFKTGGIINPNRPVYRGVSINEIAILHELEKYGFVNAKRGTLSDLGITMELDVYHPIYKIAIEYDGQKWHNQKKVETDCKKNKQCFDAGVELIRIREPECAKLTDGLSKQFIMSEATQLSNALTKAVIDMCQYLNQKYNMNIDISRFDFFNNRDVYYKKRNDTYFISRIGETKLMKNGQNATILQYRTSEDIDVQFEDNTIVQHVKYSEFASGKLSNPNLRLQVTRIGETSLSRDGRPIEIIAYRTIKDIDIKFDDGIILEHQDYTRFINKTIRHPDDLYQMPGEVRFNKWGEKMMLLEYKNKDDATIRFENGEIFKHIYYHRFKNGTIRSVKHQIENKNLKTNKTTQSFKYRVLGEKNIASNGQEMVIIEVNNSNDVKVKFSDNTIVSHVIYRMFKKGHVANPNYNVFEERKKSRLGQVSTASNGQTMTIIEYRTADDIDVQFEDGTIVRNKDYFAFQRGLIENPNLTYFQARKTNKIGETKLMKNGEYAKIIAYKDAKDISIQFDSGAIYDHLQYRTFKNGWIPSQNKLRTTQ